MVTVNILFDLDGTLTDSKPGIINCLEHALSSLRLDIPPSKTLESMIGGSLRDVFRTLLPVESSDADVEQAVSLYRQRFSTKGLFENSLYAGIPEILKELSQLGHELYLATAKPLVFAEQILDHFNLRQWFSGIYGSGLDGQHEIKRDLIAFVLNDAGLNQAQTMMVGDRFHDIHGAIHNRVYPVGVLWGYGSKSELQDAGARHLLDKPADILTLLNLLASTNEIR